LTGKNVVNRLITDLAVFDFNEQGMILIELQKGVSIKEVQEKTEAQFTVSPQLMSNQQ
jgi:3-oxoacid CoA-transferase subunit B